MFSKFKVLLSVAALVFSFSAVAFGQETAGEIQGTVKDPQSAVVSGASITITGVNVGFNRTLQTDAEGFYNARQIPPGIYEITVAASGFANQTTKNVLVALGQATTVDFNLAVSGQTEVVNVTADGGLVVDPTDTKMQENITSRQIESLPKGTNITSLLRTTAAARPEPLSGQFQINGGSGSENTFIVDGQEVTNFRTGVLNANNDIPFQSVQEVQVKSSGFEAEFGGATGGVINIVTKGGTNEWHGEFGAAFESRELWAGPRPVLTNFLTFAGTTGQFVQYTHQNRDSGLNFFPNAQIGGPIVKDKMWIFAEYTPRIFRATRTTSFIPSPHLSLVPISTESATSKQINEYARIRLDASPYNTLRFSTSFTYNPIILDGVLLGGSTVFASPSCANFVGTTCQFGGAALAATQGGRQNSNNFRGEGVWTPNSQLVVLGRYTRGYLNERLNAYGVPNIPRVRVRQFTGPFNNTTGPAVAGAPLNFATLNANPFQNNKDISIRNQVNADVSYLVSDFGGRHEFKGGYEYNTIFNDVDQGYQDLGRIDLYYGRSTWTPAFGAFPTPQFSPQPVCAAGQTTGCIRGIGTMLRFGTRGTAENKNQALYIQDKWQPMSRLTLNLGVRFEKEDLPAFNGETTNLSFSWADKFAPRLGVAYDLTGDGKTKVSASYGWFYDRLKFELPRGSFGGDFFRVDYFEIPATGDIAFNSFNVNRIRGNFNDPVGGRCPATRTALSSSTLVVCQLDYRIPSNLSGLNVDPTSGLLPGAVDPELEPFRQSEFNVQVEREMFRNSRLRVGYVYRNVDQAVEDAGFLTPQGSETYIIANPGQGLHAQRAREFGYERLVTPERRYDAVITEFDTRFVRNLSLNVNYTWSRLFGNYSGLASSDEDGRTSPGVNRFFDLPFVGFTASGRPDNGRLATDRPHVFKASGVYSKDWEGRNTTDFSFFTTIQSGTPQTTFADIYGIPIVKTVRGDLGRSETFTQSDVGLTHRYNFGNDGRWAVAFDVNVLNLFNENNVLSVDNDESSGYYLLDFSEVAPTFVQAVNILTSRGVINELNESVAHDPGFNINQTYRQPNAFQGPRQVRFGFRFMF